MTDHFFFVTLGQAFVAVVQVLNYARHLGGKLPIFLLLGWRFLQVFGILIEVLAALFLYPSKSFFVFSFVVDTQCHAADNFHFVDRFHTHAEIFFKKLGANNTAAYAHSYATYLQVTLAAHCGNGNCRAGKTQNFVLHVLRNSRVVGVLHFVSVNAESRQTLLRMSCKYASKVHRTGTFRAVETPHRLDCHGVHVHGFRTVAPTRCDGKRDVHVVFAEFVRTCRRLGNTADCRVGNDYFDGFAVTVTHVVADKFRRRMRHIHCLVFQAFAHLDLAATSVDCGTNTYYGVVPY